MHNQNFMHTKGPVNLIYLIDIILLQHCRIEAMSAFTNSGAEAGYFAYAIRVLRQCFNNIYILKYTQRVLTNNARYCAFVL